MTPQHGDAGELDDAIAHVYAGPLEAFVQRRDAAAKELRAAGRREDANAIKALRKPTRTAWALDAAAIDGSGAMDALVHAIAVTLEAQAGSGDVRQAFGELRQAVRAFAARAAVIAMSAGQRLEESALANAVLAVIGRPDDFDALRRGRLIDVPEAGGLDFLSSLPLLATPPRPAATAAVSAQSVSPPARRAGGTRASKPAGAAADVAAERQRAAARRAELALTAARERSAAAQRAIDEVESELQEAEARLRAAETDVRALRADRNRALQEVEAAAAGLIDAEKAAAAIRRVGATA